MDNGGERAANSVKAHFDYFFEDVHVSGRVVREGQIMSGEWRCQTRMMTGC